MSTFEPNILKLPAGTIVSSPIANDSTMVGHVVAGPCAASKRRNRNLGGPNNRNYEIAPLWPKRALLSAPAKTSEKSDESKSRSCIELHTFSQKPSIAKSSDLRVRGRRIFFPSTSTSQISKTPDQTDGLGDMAADFEFEEFPECTDIVALDARIASHIQAKVSGASRLSMLRPPPLDLGDTSNYTYDSNQDGTVLFVSQDNQGSRPVKQTVTADVHSAAGTPYIIRPRFNADDTSSAPVSPLTPLMLLNQDRLNESNLFDRVSQRNPLRFLNNLFRRSKPSDKIYQQVDDSMLDYRLVISAETKLCKIAHRHT